MEEGAAGTATDYRFGFALFVGSGLGVFTGSDNIVLTSFPGKSARALGMGKSNTTSLPLTLAFKPLSIWLPNSKTDVGGAHHQNFHQGLLLGAVSASEESRFSLPVWYCTQPYFEAASSLNVAGTQP